MPSLGRVWRIRCIADGLAVDGVCYTGTLGGKSKTNGPADRRGGCDGRLASAGRAEATLVAEGGRRSPGLLVTPPTADPKLGNNLSMSSAHLSALEIETWDRAKHSQHDLGMCQTFSA